jgi:hypothetical protein
MNALRNLLLAVSWLFPLGARAVTVNAEFTCAATIPVTAAGYTAAGNEVAITLGFAPASGTDLTIVRNTGRAFIAGRFANLAHGQAVDLTHNAISYRFVANYHGGSGNDLVLQWGYQEPLAWGSNTAGQLGVEAVSGSNAPMATACGGALAGRTVLALSAGVSHSLAVCADGTVAAWGDNLCGQLGDDGIPGSRVPVAVSASGTLADKMVVAVAAGGSHSLALCADGTVAAWGANDHGQLGDGGALRRPAERQDSGGHCGWRLPQPRPVRRWHHRCLGAQQPGPTRQQQLAG